MKRQRKTPFWFFYCYAGYSYDPKLEKPSRGHRRTAHLLAKAEQKAKEADNICFEWKIDDVDSSEFSDEKPPHQLWVCLMVDQQHNECLQALCGIDFGLDIEPWGQPYKRVVEAELALEHFQVQL